MKITTVFGYLARIADATYGPGATFAYIHEQAARSIDHATADARHSFRAALDGCSLSRHPLVIDRLARKAERKRQKQLEREDATVLAIAVLLRSLKKNSRSG